jgi:DNA-directed RNA polymerase specialized sigma24 family protein
MSSAETQMFLESLSPSEKRACELKSEGLTRAQTAVEMHVGINRVKNLWQSARRKAREMFGDKLSPEIRGGIFHAGHLSQMHQV